MKTKYKNASELCVRWFCVLVGFITVYIIGKRLLANDHRLVINWSIMLIAAGISFLPLINIMFSKFHDGGWIFSKTIGIAISGWLTWYLSSFFLKFSRSNCIIIIAVCAVVNYTIYVFYMYRNKKKVAAISFEAVEKKLFSAVTTELLFLFAFTMWCYLRGFKPEAYGTEKFMNYGFMSSMMRTESMPPIDMWFSGKSINYYYIGQYIAVYMTKLIGTTASYGYNLALMTIAALSMTMSYSLIYNVAKNVRNHIKVIHNFKDRVKTSAFCVFCGLLASFAVNMTASMHYPVYKFILPWIGTLTGKEIDNSYWFPDPTRYIGYNPETNDKTIHEFPSYSYILGDLHAHVINIIFVISLLAILYAFLLYRRAAMNEAMIQTAVNKQVMIKEIFNPYIIMTGFFLGLFNTTNYWDFPIYFIVAGAIILCSNAVICGFKFVTITMTTLHAVIVLVISQLVCLPFTLSFDSMATGISFTESRTFLHQLLILWGLPIFCVVVFIIAHFKKLKNEKNIIFKDKSKKNNNPLFQFIRALHISDLYMITIGLCAIGLILLPEIIYVVDIYPGHKRANTMFKLTYQAYIMFSLSMGYMIPNIIMFIKNKKYTIIGSVMLICLVWTMGYSNEAFGDWYGDVRDISRYKGLDAEAFLIKESMEDYNAISWLNENIEGLPVILEANGESYTYYQRISVFTGLPTVLGWKTHEWLWRSGKGEKPFGYPEEVAERESDVDKIYTSDDSQEVKELLLKYKVEYIYIGECEREKFESMNEDLLRSFGEVVYGNHMIQDTAYIIKLNLK